MQIQKILSELTVDEKIRLLSGDGDWHTYDCNKKVPSIMMTDGPHGLRKVLDEKVGDVNQSKPATCFPTASAVASSWDPSLSEKMAGAIAKEAKHEQISIVLGCGTNMKRSPLCGRNFEYYSEDPFLAGKMATGFIKGMENGGVGTSLKHFAGNSQETRRMTSNSEIDERALREIYLTAFEMAVKEGKPASVMASYNRINGTYGAANRHLLIDILRDEWGYEGAVISDWGATIDVANCLRNGLTLEMPDSHGYHPSVLKKAYKKGLISDAELDEWAGRVLSTLSVLAENVEEGAEVDYEENNRIAREIETKSAVLLKNEGILPIATNQRLLVVGELAENMRFQGGGSSHISPVFQKSAVETLTEAGYDVTYFKGYENDNEEASEYLESEVLTYLKRYFSKTEMKVVFFIGLTESFEGEGYDRKDLSIPRNQVLLLEKISKLIGKENIAAISFGGAPMDFSWDDKVSGVLHMYLGGQAVGEAVADLVSGKVNPSGKLAETVPLCKEDTPANRYFAKPYDDVEYRESIFMGYRYYETFDIPVKFPFGFGLSYTEFEYQNLSVGDTFESGEMIVSFDVKNIGKVAGEEIAELYVMPDTPKVMRSKTELKGFAKVFLKPGESKRVSITLNDRSFSVFDISKNAFSVIAGDYKLAVGASVKDIRLSKDIKVLGEDYFRDDREEFPSYFKPQAGGMEIPEKEFEKLYGSALSKLKERHRGTFDLTCSFDDVSKNSLMGKVVRGFVNIAVKFMFPGKSMEDPAMKMVYKTLTEGALEGLIATSGGAISPKLADMMVLNANRRYLKAFFRMFGRRV